MKKIILSLAVLTVSVGSAFATYTRTTKNGGKDGYASTKAEKDNEGNTRIDCYDPGFEACPTTAGKLTANETRLIRVAADKIKAGRLSGSYTNEGQTITLNSDSSEMYNSTVSIN